MGNTFQIKQYYKKILQRVYWFKFRLYILFKFKLPFWSKEREFTKTMNLELKSRHQKYDAMIKAAQANIGGDEVDELIKMMMAEYSTYLSPIVLYHEKNSMKKTSDPIDFNNMKLIPDLYECKAKVFDEAILHSVRVLLDRVSLMYLIIHKGCFEKKYGFGTYNPDKKQNNGFINYAKNNQDIDVLHYVSQQYDLWIHNICTNDNNLKHNGSEQIGYNMYDGVDELGHPKLASIIIPSVYSSTNKNGKFNADIHINDIGSIINKAYEFADKIILYII